MQERESRAGRKRSEASRQAILDATLALLRSHGYGGLTVDAIAVAAGVSKQTIYRWWSGKGELALEALAEHARDVNAPETGSLEGDVRAFFESTLSLLRGPRGTAAVLKGLMAEAQLDPEFTPRLRGFVESRRGALRDVLARHTRAKPLETMIDMLFGAMWYRLLLEHGALDADFAGELGHMAARALKQ